MSQVPSALPLRKAFLILSELLHRQFTDAESRLALFHGSSPLCVLLSLHKCPIIQLQLLWNLICFPSLDGWARCNNFLSRKPLSFPIYICLVSTSSSHTLSLDHWNLVTTLGITTFHKDFAASFVSTPGPGTWCPSNIGLANTFILFFCKMALVELSCL